MEVIVISPKHQMFNGENFYLCGSYYQHNGKRLHRTVWEFHNGEIPKGYHIHHIDGDRNNNSIENLQMIEGKKHGHLHGKEEARIEKSMENMKKAQVEAKKWHGSQEGYAFHSQLGKKNFENRTPITYKCTYCGKEFQSKRIFGENSNHFCHQNCKAAFRRRRVRNEGKKC